MRIETRGGSRPSVEFKTVETKKARQILNRGLRRTFAIGKVTDDF